MSERVDQLDYPEEVFYRRLMSVVDDYGRFYGNPQILRSSCFPLRTDRVTVGEISQWLAACVKAGLVAVYRAADEKDYVQIERFGQQVRANKSKFPNLETCISDDSRCNHLLSNAHSRADTDTDTDTPSTPNTHSDARARQPIRLHGIPENAEVVIAYGATLNPKVQPQTCRDFWAHYEGQARTAPNGDVFWITGGANETVITNWKVKLPSFGGIKSNANHRQTGQRGFDRNAGTFNDPSKYDLKTIEKQRALQKAQQLSGENNGTKPSA